MKSYLSDLKVDRWWRSWNKKVTTSLSVAPGLEVSFTMAQDILSGESNSEGVINAKGNFMFGGEKCKASSGSPVV